MMRVGEKVMSSCEDVHINIAGQLEGMGLPRRIEFLTLLIDGIALKLCGSSSSSFTRCARRTGSSSVKVRMNGSKEGNRFT